MNRLLLPLACNRGGRWFAGAGGQLQSHHFILLKLKLSSIVFFFPAVTASLMLRISEKFFVPWTISSGRVTYVTHK